SCDVLFNGVGTEVREPQLAAPLRVWMQTDPVTHELAWAAGDAFVEDHVRAHHIIATYGENYGASDCGVPLIDAVYVKTRQPIDLELWPAVPTPHASHFTTIGNYRQEHKDVEYNGEMFRWSKHHEWAKFIDLPSRTDQSFLV